MAALMKMLAVVLMAVVPGGLILLMAFVLARSLATKIRSVEQGPQRYRRALATVTLRDVWNEARRSL
ncbi:MAG: hypothetical protein H6Q89_3825 [Myxococcaceae bacterium]|nr:hypothetical protein [Myxococcaceae bacterium]